MQREVHVGVEIDLSGRVALVTGAAAGIGLSIARTLSDAGAVVARADVNDRALAENDLGLPVPLDVTQPASAAAAVAAIASELGPVDILVNNAGVAARRLGLPFTNQEISDWDGPLSVNLVGTFVISREVGVQMMARRTGVIVNIASVAGSMGSSTDPAYSASKAGVIALTKTFARDLAPYGIRANSICPGMVMTPFYQLQYEAAARVDLSIAAMSVEEYFADKAGRLIPLGRGQQASDIANAVLFLASDLASCITGQSLHVDGGLIMH